MSQTLSFHTDSPQEEVQVQTDNTVEFEERNSLELEEVFSPLIDQSHTLKGECLQREDFEETEFLLKKHFKLIYFSAKVLCLFPVYKVQPDKKQQFLNWFLPFCIWLFLISLPNTIKYIIPIATYYITKDTSNAINDAVANLLSSIFRCYFVGALVYYSLVKTFRCKVFHLLLKTSLHKYANTKRAYRHYVFFLVVLAVFLMLRIFVHVYYNVSENFVEQTISASTWVEIIYRFLSNFISLFTIHAFLYFAVIFNWFFCFVVRETICYLIEKLNEWSKDSSDSKKKKGSILFAAFADVGKAMDILLDNMKWSIFGFLLNFAVLTTYFVYLLFGVTKLSLGLYMPNLFLMLIGLMLIYLVAIPFAYVNREIKSITKMLKLARMKAAASYMSFLEMKSSSVLGQEDESNKKQWEAKEKDLQRNQQVLDSLLRLFTEQPHPFTFQLFEIEITFGWIITTFGFVNALVLFFIKRYFDLQNPNYSGW